MSERTGLGPLEEALVLTLDDLGARPDRPHVKSALVLVELERNFDYGPRYAYEALCDLARPWMVWLILIDGHGNFGTPDFPAAEARYTECRLSPAGALMVAAERSQIPALPLRFINGTHYRGGTQPPFQPRLLLDGLARLVDDRGMSDNELLALVGPPAFPTGCHVAGDIEKLLAGRPATLRLTAVIRRQEERGAIVLEVSNLPPGMGSSAVTQNIASRVRQPRWVDDHQALAERTRLVLSDVEDLSTGTATKIRCTLARDADPSAAAERLREVWGVSIGVSTQLPAPLPALLRSWVNEYATDDTPRWLARLREVVPG